MAPTAFIAVQCYECATMQVKQQKKSSNKWRCVVCNSNQSVTKVYFRALMAKEVRFFVQRFNMSRMEADRRIEAAKEVEEDRGESGGLKKRTDWSEYIDQEEEEEEDLFGKGNAFEPNVVTELPKELFTRPKLKNAMKGSCNNDKGFRPVFQKRYNTAKRTRHGNLMEMGHNESQQMMRQGSDELTGYTMVPGKESDQFQQSFRPLRREGYENQNRDGDYVSGQQKMTSKVAFKCNGNTVADGHSSGNADCPEKQNGKSQFAAIALKFKGIGVQHEKKLERLEVTLPQKKATMISKWNDYITEDDDDDDDDDGARGYSRNLQGESCRDLLDSTNHWKSEMYGTNLVDQKVEEDIHPDFL